MYSFIFKPIGSSVLSHSAKSDVNRRDAVPALSAFTKTRISAWNRNESVFAHPDLIYANFKIPSESLEIDEAEK